MSDIVPYERHGDRFLTAPAATPQFTAGITRHHRPDYDDYEVAKQHIFQALGDIYGPEGLRLFGKEVAIACFVRPAMYRVSEDKVWFRTIDDQKEDWFQHKVAMIIATGPSAFRGDDSYVDAQFGECGPPKIGDWVFCNASNGIQISLRGDGASRPQGVDNHGNPCDLFAWDGWPVRIISDDQFLGMIGKPQQIV